ncbi:CoA transferase subunit A [Candidatus Thorarchaeota archaeon]|jgi:glutaconate CoA-transferase subunit A|nr:MAG: CoA transferase subunit A [Candidatus Thorarchaeota archaeon]
MTEAEVEDKRITLAEAAKKVGNGSGLFWGGFGYQRPPIAFAHELVRQKKKNITVYTCGSEVDLEIMAGANVANRYEIAFAAIEALGLSYNIRRRVSEGLLEVEDYSNLAMAMRFLGGALNVPFMPIRSMMGTDMVRLTRYLGDKKLKVIDCPFTGDKICLVPSIQPDFSIVHVQRVDKMGNAQIDGIVGEDIEGSRCGKKLIVLAEELIDREEVKKSPVKTQIPGMYVDHVVILPYVAHPMQCHDYYDYDLEHLMMFHKLSRTEEGWQEYLENYILGVDDHFGYLNLVGWDRLNELKAKKPWGY